MMDPAIVFIVRELVVNLYTHNTPARTTLIGFSGLIAAMGIVRTLAVFFSPSDEN